MFTSAGYILLILLTVKVARSVKREISVDTLRGLSLQRCHSGDLTRRNEWTKGFVEGY
jgi:hypothetical protein